MNGYGGNGGSGIVVIRGTQDDVIPVWFDGTQLNEMYFNGTKVESLYFNGAKMF